MLDLRFLGFDEIDWKLLPQNIEKRSFDVNYC